jgi:addiction module HigA family antidote
MTMKNPPHPGLVVLQECIEPLGLTITDAAEALGVTRNALSELVDGKRGISPEMAVRLSEVFGGSEQGWLVQQAQYDLAQVRRERIKLKRLQPVPAADPKAEALIYNTDAPTPILCKRLFGFESLGEELITEKLSEPFSPHFGIDLPLLPVVGREPVGAEFNVG